MDYYGFYTGKIFDAHKYLGGRLTDGGAVFATFAPNAGRVSLIGDFNGWQETPMNRVYDRNFWEIRMENAQEGMRYKYRIYRRDGSFIDHCDPYGFSMELRPANASILRRTGCYPFTDGAWMKNRTDCKRGPLNIYEMHFGSFRKKTDDREGWYSYEEMAGILIPWLKKNGYNYLEVLPLAEHPSDESWGYQNTGFFSPTSRYGTPDQLKFFVDRCHADGIGVLLDFVPVHFAVDGYALANYDGTALYEYPNMDVGRSEWGSCNFMHSRGEVRSFLQSAAHYWLEEFHFDGLRVDAISNMIYWQGDKARGENKNAISFLQEMNTGLKRLHPTAILAAEDSTAFWGVTKPVKEGGLGFDYKWDMGWMNDTLSYFQTPPADRSRDYHKLTFSMQYFYDEQFLLPFSHDENVHGKATIAQKMYGSPEGKFPQARALYLYMYAHPGKKLNFMGGEFAQLREWDESRQQDWQLLDCPLHSSFRHFMEDLCRLYLETPALYEMDYDRDGFRWRDCHQEAACVYAFERCAAVSVQPAHKADGSPVQRLLAVFNFSDRICTDYELTIPGASQLSLLIDSDGKDYGGAGGDGRETVPVTENGAAVLTLAPWSGRYYLIQ